MNNSLSKIGHWTTDKLIKIAEALRLKSASPVGPEKFVDLAPTDEADQGGVYSAALKFATDSPDVSNIALTGPYGSGKSSIIRSFLRSYPRQALHISLAAFLPEAEDERRTVTKQEVERSILQQLLYGADANKLPLSRFKRIQSPSFWSIFRSFYILIGLLALWYMFNNRAAIFDGSYFKPFDITSWIDISVAVFVLIFLWSVIHHFYVASFGVSLKSISLKDIEIRPSSDDQDSILNRHLDEIVYFFQSTRYDLVGGVRIACWCAFILPETANIAPPSLLEDPHAQDRLRRPRLKASAPDAAAAGAAGHSRDRLPAKGRGRARSRCPLRGGSWPGLSALRLVEAVPVGAYPNRRAALAVR
ncbi:hypothetical protein SAMN04515678_1031 [Roseivivax sediminis]|uniref:YobI-like P-loop NTPase domain-containing protein n=1 Tax=Roseivivax sediminis TaxID=936889 RepID=A0A1I1V3T8_9RHOB|nr:hypothetical protein [Roseivivax sediminis]SFD77702.1 hypothetical protein SAMN04515678_1031 [Roseivivax sediminis]